MRATDVYRGLQGQAEPLRESNRNAQAMPSEEDNSPQMEEAVKCMSVFEERNKIAFACYDEERNEIILEQSHIHDNDQESIAEGFVAVARPNLVLIGGKMAENSSLLNVLTRLPPNAPMSAPIPNAQSNGEQAALQPNTSQKTNGTSTNQSTTHVGAPTSIPYRLLKSGAFDVRKCRSLILHKLRVLTLLRQPPGGTRGVAAAGYNGERKTRIEDSFMNRGTGFGVRDDRQREFPGGTLDDHQDSAPPSRYHSLSAVIDFDSNVLVRALGGLISFLQGTIFRLEEGSTVTINAIQHAHSANYMRIDTATLQALHIFAIERHPLVAKGNGNAKEGFSLFTLLDRTKSKIGRQCMREWMLKPLLDANAIKERHDGVDLFLKPECHESVGTLLQLLQRVGAVDKILLRMQKCVAVPNDFLVLSRTLSAAVSICSILAGDVKEHVIRSYSTELEGAASGPGDHLRGHDLGSNGERAMREIAFVDRILDRCNVSIMRDLHERIVSTVDEEATAEAQKIAVIHYGLNEELDNAKEEFEKLNGARTASIKYDEPKTLYWLQNFNFLLLLALLFFAIIETLSVVGSQCLEKHPELRQVKVVFLPQVGFLVSIDKRHHSHNVATNEFPDLSPEFTFVFLQNNDAYFKNPEMRQMDDEIGDLDAFIKDTESMIVSNLEADILDCESELRCTFGALAELDCILSFASCAADLNFVRPEILQNQRGIHINHGRHPLQELVIDDEFIANDTAIDEKNQINVITGPNFSGKSCYTRQVGVLVYLAHIGCFLPCSQARISITDQIVARISTVETCTIPQSSFQLDLTQMAGILRKSTSRTLVLIDEFGKGTAPASGIAVLAAALKKLASINCSVVCTTHLLEIFSLGILKDGQDGIKVLQMAVHIPHNRDDSAVPLFQLKDGVANSSAGLVCAKMAGVKNSIVGRATEILHALKDGCPVQPIAARLNSNSALQPTAKAALRLFLGVDSWITATDEELQSLHQKIVCM